MVRKTDEEKLKELEMKMDQIKVKKQQVASRIKQKERKERTRRLIQVGAIFESYFDIAGEDQAEKIAFGMKETIKKHKEKLLQIDVEKSKKENKIIYEIPEEQIIMPAGDKPTYKP